VAAAVVFTLTTHVPLPGLDRLLGPQGAEETSRATDAGPGETADPTGSALLSGLGGTRAARLDTTGPDITGPSDPRRAPALDRPRRPVNSATTQGADDGGRPASSRSSAPAPTATPGPTTPATPATTHTPSRGTTSGNPHATAKSANSAARTEPQATRTANPKADAARTKSKPSAAPTAVPTS
jgi:hypothetical protein